MTCPSINDAVSLFSLVYVCNGPAVAIFRMNCANYSPVVNVKASAVTQALTNQEKSADDGIMSCFCDLVNNGNPIPIPNLSMLDFQFLQRTGNLLRMRRNCTITRSSVYRQISMRC